MQSSDYATSIILRAREAELNRIAERVRIAYERRDELRAEQAKERAAGSGRPKDSGSLANAVAAVAARLSLRWKQSVTAWHAEREKEPGPARHPERERESLHR